MTPKIQREEVVIDVGDAVPELDRAVAVQERARRLHGKCLDAAPQVACVTDHLACHALDVDDEHPPRGERERVATTLERHVDDLVWQQHRRVRSQLLLHNLWVDGTCIAAEQVQELAHLAVLFLALRLRRDLHRSIANGNIENFIVEQAVERKEVHAAALLE